MKTRPTHPLRHPLAAGLLAGLLGPGFAGAATTLIGPDLNNGSFEYINGVNDPAYTTKITQWDGHAAGEIDHWTLWSGNSDDSGSQHWDTGGAPEWTPPRGPTGVRFAFLQPGNAVHNLTAYVIQAGDRFTLSWDHVGTHNNAHTVSLVYSDGTDVLAIPGTEVFATDSGVAYGDTFTIPADSPAIGHAVGLGVISASGWAEVDNFALSVTPVPEPSVVLLGALGLLGFPRRRSGR